MKEQYLVQEKDKIVQNSGEFKVTKFKKQQSKMTQKLAFHKLYKPSGPWSPFSSPVSVVLSRWESLSPPGRDTNPSQVSSKNDSKANGKTNKGIE